MFAFLSGTVAELAADRAVIDVGGVGYEVFASGRTLSSLKIGAKAKLYTHVNFTQDNVLVYGFADADEKSMFRRLISVSRVGPKAALSVLTSMSPADVAMCVVSDDEKALSRVPGLGKKTAQRIILELKEKIAAEEAAGGSLGGAASIGELTDDRSEAFAALVALGYDPGTAKRAVAAVGEPTFGVEDILKTALRDLGRNR